MTNPKPQTKPQAKPQKDSEKNGALSDAALNKISGGNMPTAVERSKGTR
jgi:hypothetical protein